MAVNNRNKRRVLLVTGVAFVAIGVIFVALGLNGLYFPISCPISGCPSITSSYYAPYWYEIYVGVAMIVLGVGMIIGSRKIPIGEKDRTHSS